MTKRPDPPWRIALAEHNQHYETLKAKCLEGAAEIERLRAALDNSQSLLTAMLIERRPQNEIESQIIENRGALNHEQSAPEGDNDPNGNRDLAREIDGS